MLHVSNIMNTIRPCENKKNYCFTYASVSTPASVSVSGLAPAFAPTSAPAHSFSMPPIICKSGFVYFSKLNSR